MLKKISFILDFEILVNLFTGLSIFSMDNCIFSMNHLNLGVKFKALLNSTSLRSQVLNTLSSALLNFACGKALVKRPLLRNIAI